MEKKMCSSPLHRDPRLPELYTLYAQKQECQTKIRSLRKRISATHDILQLEELKCRKRVLRRLGFTNSSDIAEMKGRVACEISTGDELLLTELIFNGVFNTLTPEHSAGLLSCFVFTEKVLNAASTLFWTWRLTCDHTRVNNKRNSRKTSQRPCVSCKNSPVGLPK